MELVVAEVEVVAGAVLNVDKIATCVFGFFQFTTTLYSLFGTQQYIKTD
jgi:hypothetical protein